MSGMNEDCEKCGSNRTATCCDFSIERKEWQAEVEELKHQIKLEQILKATYSDIVKRLEEKISKLESNIVSIT